MTDSGRRLADRSLAQDVGGADAGDGYFPKR